MNNKMHRLFSRGIRLIVVIFLMGIVFSYAMFQGGFVSWFVFYSVTPFLLYSFLLNFAPIRITHVERTIQPSILRRGDTACVTVRFQNRSLFPFLFVAVQELGGEHSFYEKSKGHANTIFFVGWRRKFEWTYHIENLHRGEFSLRALMFTFSDFFGFTIRQKIVHEPQTIVVFPKITELTYKQLQLFSKSGAISPFSFQRDTANVTSVRNYQAGDRFAWIHWKSFAKDSTLRTKEFEHDRVQQLILTINRSSKKYFEETVELAASMVQSVVNQRGDISFLSVGKERLFFPNIKASASFDRVMNHFAIVQPNATERFDVVLAKECNYNRSATFVVITGELTERLKHFFVNSGQSIICLLLVEEQDVEQVKIHAPNVKVVPISQRQFRDVFTEVMKP